MAASLLVEYLVRECTRSKQHGVPWLTAWREALPKTHAHDLVQSIDLDGDGYISQEEMAIALWFSPANQQDSGSFLSDNTA